MLFAELSEGGQVGVLAVATLCGGAVTWVASQWWSWRAARRKEQLEDETRELVKLENLVKRLDTERVELREDVRKLESEMDALQADLRAAIVKAERMSVWIRYLETKLDEAKVPYHKLELPPDAAGPPLPGGRS